jgi:sugar phosphate permease
VCECRASTHRFCCTGLSKSEVGLIASNFALAYGCSKFGSSVISDHIDCKHLFIIGLLCTSLTSLLFPFVGNSVGVLSAVWFVNGLVQVWVCVVYLILHEQS